MITMTIDDRIYTGATQVLERQEEPGTTVEKTRGKDNGLGHTPSPVLDPGWGWRLAHPTEIARTGRKGIAERWRTSYTLVEVHCGFAGQRNMYSARLS